MPSTIYSEGSERLAALLREHRERAGLRQVDVAERLGKPQSYVSDYERGQRRLDLVELDAVCRALGVDVTDFVRRWSGDAGEKAET